jgi:hypothetical protein
VIVAGTVNLGGTVTVINAPSAATVAVVNGGTELEVQLAP